MFCWIKCKVSVIIIFNTKPYFYTYINNLKICNKFIYLTVLIFIHLIPSIVFAQKQSAHWFFGYNAGLDFNSGAPVEEPGGQLQTFEGSASISDNDGNLLFYTDGITVFDRNHNVMLNGTRVVRRSF